ncbi:MAG: hypothetical protein QOC96_1601 [Acidobacteriota bacterium]|nr:hypothetical protein [Acidobacteriota bacterium]
MFVELRRKKWFPFALVAVALIAVLASRIAIARYLATDEDDDGRVYAQIATNLLEHHVFSHADKEPYPPSLIRLPGYPLFLAAIYSVFGHGNNTAVRLIQAVFDTATCALIALIAWNWVQDERRRRIAAWAAFALAALCPFTAIYVATILTETLTLFFMAAMTLAATYAFKAQTRKRTIIWWLVAGLLSGACVLLRPDSGLFAAAIGLTLVISGLFRRTAETENEARRRFKSRLARTTLYGALFSAAFVLVLVPWTIRNARVFHLFQPLAPAHAEMPGEFVQRGYFMWVRTWIDDPRYIEPMLWNLDDKPISINDVPDFAFDSADERTRVAALLDRYNHPPQEEQNNSAASQPAVSENADAAKPNTVPQSPTDKSAAPQDQANANSGDQNSQDDNQADDQSDESDDNSDNNDNADEGDQSPDETQPATDQQAVEMTPEIDAGFAQLARERIARAPFRYYVWLPVKRAVAMWFNTHSNYYPFEGDLFPLEDLDYDTHQHIWLPLFAALVWIHTLLALAGAILLWLTRDGASRRWLLLAVLMTLPRLIFLSTLENPESRYVIELFAFTSILGGIAIARISFKGLFEMVRRRKKNQTAAQAVEKLP